MATIPRGVEADAESVTVSVADREGHEAEAGVVGEDADPAPAGRDGLGDDG